jgi:hypothetical protein
VQILSYVYTYIHTYIQTHIHTYIHTLEFITKLCVCRHIHTYVYIHTHTKKSCPETPSLEFITKLSEFILNARHEHESPCKKEKNKKEKRGKEQNL